MARNEQGKWYKEREAFFRVIDEKVEERGEEHFFLPDAISVHSRPSTDEKNNSHHAANEGLEEAPSQDLLRSADEPAGVIPVIADDGSSSGSSI